ncbi:hypothetical protein QYE76_014989 [Lolium multiflorum]|uniref:Uncharacterized protein n=1 Tax=Lolium multiflorum TaxID=4521 RepID=A0AAD8U5X4_LOLMU|nr:hypothetical protein QYE76_014989 [Lolium multiflorum]
MFVCQGQGVSSGIWAGLFPCCLMYPWSWRDVGMVMDNYKNVPQFLYGLSPSQMEMFMADDNPYNRKSTKVTEESVASSRSYSMSALQVTTWVWAMPSMSMGRAGRGYRRMRSSTPDLPSLLLDSRIIFLGMPIVPAITELLLLSFCD